jgi:putative phage-type endonuclease
MSTERKVAVDRRGFLGSSDIAAIIGVSPWKDALRLYAEKRGEIELDERESKVQRRGKFLEPAIIKLYKEVYVADIEPGLTMPLPDAPHFRAQIDAIELDDQAKGRIPIEIKSASEYARGKWGPSGTDDAPTYYCAQLHWQLLATGAPYGRIVALLGADDLRVYTIERDQRVGEYLLSQAQEFWARLQDGIPPEIDFEHPTAGETLAKLFRNFEPTEILQADAALRSWRDVMAESAALETRYKAAKETARAHLLAAMRTAGVIDFGDGQMLERKVIKRRGYTVDATEYVSARLVNAKAGASALALPERIDE